MRKRKSGFQIFAEGDVEEPVSSNVNMFCPNRFQQPAGHITCTMTVFLQLNKWKDKKQRELHTIN